MILPQKTFFQNIKIKLNSNAWMTLKSSVVIFQALKPLQPQWPQWPQQPQWPQWPRQPHLIKFFADPDGWIIPGTQMTKLTLVASATSLASTASTAQFPQKTSWFRWSDHPQHQNDQYWSLFVEWIIKNPIFYWFNTFSVRGCWGQPMLLFWKLVDETEMPTTPDATSHHSSRKFSILLPLRAI